MIVCHCHSVSDRAIRRAAREGAQSAAEVTRHCGAGGTCGGCRPRIESIVEHEQNTRARTQVVTAVPTLAQAG
jgi:bacterioferritin-associated ferredoxin